MRTRKLTVAYDGTAYAGWQRQRGPDTIQARLEAALEAIEGRGVTVHGAGRTDAGVHAVGQVASVALAHPIGDAALTRALNAALPADIRVRRVEAAPDGFHARYDALGKTYRYRIDRGPVADPLARRFAWHVPAPLDVDAMRVAAQALVGRHDFAAFQSASGAGSPVSTVRTIRALSIDAAPAPMLAVTVRGDGYLRHMVRAIVGTLVEVGRRRRAADGLAAVIASKRRGRAGPTAPAHGLCLVQVDYDDAPVAAADVPHGDGG